MRCSGDVRAARGGLGFTQVDSANPHPGAASPSVRLGVEIFIADAADPDRMATEVAWTLEPEGKGTRLFLEHSGFDPDDPTQQLARRFMNGGWRSHVLRRLADVLSHLAEPSASGDRPQAVDHR